VVYTLLGRAPVVTQADLERYGTAPARPPSPPRPCPDERARVRRGRGCGAADG